MSGVDRFPEMCVRLAARGSALPRHGTPREGEGLPFCPSTEKGFSVERAQTGLAGRFSVKVRKYRRNPEHRGTETACS